MPALLCCLGEYSGERPLRYAGSVFGAWGDRFRIELGPLARPSGTVRSKGRNRQCSAQLQGLHVSQVTIGE